MHEILSAIKSVMAEDDPPSALKAGYDRAPAWKGVDDPVPAAQAHSHMKLGREEIALWLGHAPGAVRDLVEGSGSGHSAAAEERDARIAELERQVSSLEEQNKEMRLLLAEAEAALRVSGEAAPSRAQGAAEAPVDTMADRFLALSQLLVRTGELNIELQRQLFRQNADKDASGSRAQALHSICEIVDRLKEQSDR